jgi:putative phosphoesterase
MIIGVISDTHGLLRPEAVEFLRGSEHIIHAGDIGSPEIVPELQKIAPVAAIRGNVDVQPWTRSFAETEVVELAGLHIYVIHDVNALDLNPRAAGFAAVISGHSHKPGQSTKDGVLYFNPGSAGPRRFSLPISIGRLEIVAGAIRGSLHTL